MNHYYLLTLFILGCCTSRAQNLVPNPSFERFTACPNTAATIPYSPGYNNFPFVADWVSPTNTTPDFKHFCGFSLGGAPGGALSWQMPRTGNAYAGIYTLPPTASTAAPIREYLECRLTQPMTAGHFYHVSFYCTAAEFPLNPTTMVYGIDKVGALFTTAQVAVPTNNALTYTPQVTSAPGVPISDTQNWVRVQGIYQAGGGEEWLTLGRFDDGLPVTTGVIRQGANGTNLSYLLIDDINVFDLAHPESAFSHMLLLCAPSFPVTLSGRAGGSAWQWSNNASTPVIQASGPGTYWVRTWKDTMYYTDTIHISSNVPQTMFLPKDTAVCTGAPLILAPGHPMATYQWSTGATTPSITVTASGTYTLSATDSCGTQRDTIQVYYPPKLQLPRDTAVCNGQTVTVSANPDFPAYAWSTGAATKAITVTQTGSYILTATDVCGPQRDTVQVMVYPPVPVPLIKDTVICQGIAAPKLAVAGDSIRWYVPPAGTGTFTQPVINTTATGRQTFDVTQTRGGCESGRQSVKLEVISRPVADLGSDTTLCDSMALLLGPVVGPGTDVRWSSGETFSPIVVRTTGIYRLTLTNVCSAVSDDKYVRFRDCDTGSLPVPGLQGGCLFVPTAFTPNGDSRNDRFRATSVCALQRFRLVILNRVGQVVFETHDLNDGWDGTYKGQPAAMDTYFYLAEFLQSNTGNVGAVVKGDFILMR